MRLMLPSEIANNQFELHRSATQQQRSHPRNPPEPVAPIFVSPSRTPVKLPRQSTDGNSREQSPIWIMSSIIKRQCPWGGMREAQEEAHRVSRALYFYIKGRCWKTTRAKGRDFGGKRGNPPSLPRSYTWRKDWQYLIKLLSRKTIRRLSRPLASQICRVPPRTPKKRRSKRRHQRPRHGQPHREAHPSESSPQAAPPYLSCSWSRKSLSDLFPITEQVQTKTANNNSAQINPYMSNPCHIELILTEGEEVVQKGPHVANRESVKLNSRQRGARVRRAITAS